MKIAIFTDVYGPGSGGIASSIDAQKHTLEKQGHEVTIFFPYLKKSRNKYLRVVPTLKHFHPDGIPIACRAKTVEKWVLAQYPNFDKTFDIVHVHYEAATSIAGARLARRFKIPLIQTMHGREDSAVMENIWCPFRTIVAFLLCFLHSLGLPHNIKVHRDNYLATTYARAFMWSLMVNQANYADVVITPSRHFRDKFQHYGVTRPIKVLTNTIDDRLIPKSPQQRQLKKNEPLLLVWNSRISHEKRIWEFLHALKAVKFPYKFEVFGDGNELKKARSWAKHHKLPITFHGSTKRPQILTTMAHSHLSILASYNFDNQPMTLLEATASGLPIFFCDPDMKEVVPEGSYLCADGPSPEQMAAALDDLYEHPERIAKMSKAALDARHSVLRSSHEQDLLQIYNELRNHQTNSLSQD